MVRLTKLARRFGPLLAVDDVSFSVARGEVLGFLGPNGAGKSTAMRVLTGFIPPSSGTASVMGYDIVEHPIEAKRRIGYLPEGAPAYGDMTVLGFLDFIAAMRGFEAAERRNRVGSAIEKASLPEVAHRPIETLSKGYKRRVGIAQAILHDPPVLVLDEPTDGLDPNQKHEMRKLIKEMAEDKAIIVSTHILEEVDAVCSRAVIISRGRIVADARPDELKRRSEWHNAVRITTNVNLLPRVEAIATTVPRVAEVRVLDKVNGVGSLLVVPSDAAEIGVPVASALREAGVEVDQLVVEQGRLDDVFRELTSLPSKAASIHH